MPVGGPRGVLSVGAPHRSGARESGKRVGFVASGSVSHKLVRGPEKGPRPEDEELDHRLAKMVAAGQYADLWSWLPEFSRATQAEMGGRHLAMMLGAVDRKSTRLNSSHVAISYAVFCLKK